jgi:hypothetical protein
MWIKHLNPITKIRLPFIVNPDVEQIQKWQDARKSFHISFGDSLLPKMFGVPKLPKKD